MRNCRQAPLMLASLLLHGCTLNLYHTHPIKTGAHASASPTASESPAAYGVHDTLLQMTALGSLGYARFAAAEPVTLSVQTSVDAFLHCYYQQANGEIVKIFPNRFSQQYWLPAGHPLDIPSTDNFQILASTGAKAEAFLCLMSEKDLVDKLPSVYTANLFQALPVENFDELYALYQESTAANLMGKVLNIAIR